MTKKICFVLIVVLLFALPAITQEPNTAAAQLTTDTPHFQSGDEVSFTMKLNEPLPEGARFDVRLSPVSVNQEITISSQEPSDKDRKEFLLKFKLPDHARGGEWHIATVYLFLPNVSWTSSTIATNEMKFVVDGPNGPLPSNATATIVKKEPESGLQWEAARSVPIDLRVAVPVNAADDRGACRIHNRCVPICQLIAPVSR